MGFVLIGPLEEKNMGSFQSESEIETLAQAKDLLARQAEEIKQLQQQLVREDFAQKLRKLLISSQASSTVFAPFTHTHVLEMVVHTAARVIGSKAASLFLIEETTQDLFFEVAIGPVAQEIKKYRVPPGQGIVGLVVATGQAMAVTNVSENIHFEKEIAFAVNYIPENMLCVPLFYDGRIIGALEFLDKIGQPSFGPEDIEILGLFANIAAMAIAQSQANIDQQKLLLRSLMAFAQDAEGDESATEKSLGEGIQVYMDWLSENDELNTKAQQLALLLQEIIYTGEQECELCITILQGIIGNLRQRNQFTPMTSNAGSRRS
jgi:GAF domain-containing protein